MAGRLNKTGINYFSFDVDFFQDEKIQFISARFGIKGEAVVVRLLCKIYRNGYYTEWNDDTALLFAKSVGDGCLDSFVKDVVFELLKRGFFDKSIFERFSVLTGSGVQKRYFKATERYKSVNVFKEFLLVDVSKMINVNIISINVNINSKNDDINTQIEKEKKGNRNKIKEYISPIKKSANDVKTDFNFYFSEYNRICISLPKIEKLTESRKRKIAQKEKEFGREKILEVFALVEQSDFLSGRSDKWQASFDWIMKYENFLKILEGNYKNKSNGINSRVFIDENKDYGKATI